MAEKKSKKANELDEMSLDELIEKSKQVKELLAGLENQYRSAEITEQSYKQTKDANTKKLNEVKKRLEEWGIKDEDIPAPAAPVSPAMQKPAAGTSAAPALAAPSQASAPAAASATTPPSPAAQKTAPVPPPAQAPVAPVFAPAAEAQEPLLVTETPAPQPAPAPQMSFAQKLKQQFIPPAAPRAQDDPAYISQTVQLELQKFQEKFNVELERIKASIDAMKENRASSDERIHMLTEGIAELRSNVFQREAGIKEQEMKLTKIKEMVDEIEPQKISKEFSKRDKTSSDIEVRLEKLELKMGDVGKTINDINALMKSIGGLENVASIDHEVTKKLTEIKEINTSTERLSSKIEKIFIDINKRLEKFDIYEARQDNMSEIVNDMIRNFDALSLKFESYAEKKEIATAKEDIADIQKKMEELKKALKKAIPFAETMVPEEIQALQTEREDIESLLSTIEYEHEKKQISNDEYNSIREKNGARLKGIKEKIAQAMKKITPAGEENGSAAGAANAKKQSPPLVNAMLDDMGAIKAAAKKEAEESKKKDEAAKEAAENEAVAEGNEDSEESGDEDNEASDEEAGEGSEATETEENGGSEKEEEESKAADSKEDKKDNKKETAEKKPSKKHEINPEKENAAGEPAKEALPEASDEDIEKAVAEELRIHENLCARPEPEPEHAIAAAKKQGKNNKREYGKMRASPAKEKRAAAGKTKQKEHKRIRKAREIKEKNENLERATRMFLRANEIKEPKVIRAKAKAPAPKNIAKKKTAPQKPNKIIAKKQPQSARRIPAASAKPAAKKAIAASQAVRIEKSAVAKEKTSPSANKAAVKLPEIPKPRKSLRSSHDLFVPAKDIAGIKSVISAGAQNAQIPEKQKAIAAPQKTAENAAAKGANGTASAAKEVARETAPAPAKEVKKKGSDERGEQKAIEETNPLLVELNDSLKQGLISKETYENTKKLLMMG